MQEEKIKLLTEKIIIELAPQGEVWESKKILDLLKKPKGEERINFWRDSLQIDMQALEGKTSLQKEKSLLKSIESSLLPCFENLVDQKKIYVLYEINAKKQKTTKYTLAFPWETYQCDTQKFLEGLQEEQKKHLAELALEQEKIKEQQRQNLERLALEQEKIKEQQRQNLEQLALEQEKIRQEREKEIARQEQEQRERLFFLQQAEEKEKAHIQILKEMKEISEKIPSLMKSPLGDSQEFLKQIQKLFPKPEKKQANFFKKEEEKKPLKNSAPEKKLEIPFPVQKELFPEISLEDVCQKLHSVYSELRILEKHHAIKIHLLRRELNFPRETFDQAIKTLASQRKIDLVPADEENFERDERRDAYYDAIEDRTYYFIQWR